MRDQPKDHGKIPPKECARCVARRRSGRWTALSAESKTPAVHGYIWQVELTSWICSSRTGENSSHYISIISRIRAECHFCLVLFFLLHGKLWPPNELHLWQRGSPLQKETWSLEPQWNWSSESYYISNITQSLYNLGKNMMSERILAGHWSTGPGFLSVSESKGLIFHEVLSVPTCSNSAEVQPGYPGSDRIFRHQPFAVCMAHDGWRIIQLSVRCAV